MEKLILVRKEDEVYFENRKLVVNPQASKGLKKEVVKIEGLPNSNGKKWISLSLLRPGKNEVECTARILTSTLGKPATAKVTEVEYRLNADEQKQVDKLYAQIDKIIKVAKDRFVPEPKLTKTPEEMTKDELEEAKQQWLKYLGFLESDK